uniref:ATP-dependent RNA helicase n=1 Tax=Panagrolaimus sp. ES5 TaxID=591445 RepID=A0AC34FRI0_9BILA
MQFKASHRLLNPNQLTAASKVAMSDSEDEYSAEEEERKHFKQGASQSSSYSRYRRNDDYKHNHERFQHQSKRTHNPKIQVEFTGTEEGHKFDFNSEELKFAFNNDLISLYADEEDDVRFEHFVIPVGDEKFPKSNFAIFDTTLIENLAKENITTMRPSQIATMQAVFFTSPAAAPSPPDFICISSTGSGKTIAYLAPMIQKCMTRIEENPEMVRRSPTVLIFAHSNPLVVNIYQRAKKLAAETGVKIELVAGGQNFLKNTYFDIGICTIGRFMSQLEGCRDGEVKLNLENLKYLIVDEADVMSADNDFRKIVDKIKTKDMRTFLFSATLSTIMYSVVNEQNMYSFAGGKINEAAGSIKQYFWPVSTTALSKISGVHTVVNEQNMYSFAGGKINEAAGSIKQYFWPVSTTALSKISGVHTGTLSVGRYDDYELRHPFDALFHFLHHKIFNKSSNKSKVMVFMKRTIVADYTARKLNIFGFPAISVHGKQLFHIRQKLLQKFINGDVRVLFATNLLTRGTDIDVDYVINYDLPEDYANWVHRCGRTGRNGKIGVAINFIDKKNINDYPLHTLQQIVLHANMENAPLFMKDIAEFAKAHTEDEKHKREMELAEEEELLKSLA